MTMRKATLLTVMAILVGLTFAGAQSQISGRVTGPKNEPLHKTLVSLYLQGKMIDTALTDLEGKYVLTRVTPGNYQIRVREAGHRDALEANLTVHKNRKEIFNFNIPATIQQVPKNVVVIRGTRPNIPPLIDAKKPGGRTSKTAGQIEKMPTTNIREAASLSTQSYQAKNGQGISLGGGRGTGTTYIVDGVHVSGSDESYQHNNEHGYKNVRSNPLSTISVVF